MMKRFKKAIKIIAIIVVIVFLGFPVTLFYVDYYPYILSFSNTYTQKS